MSWFKILKKGLFAGILLWFSLFLVSATDQQSSHVVRASTTDLTVACYPRQSKDLLFSIAAIKGGRLQW